MVRPVKRETRSTKCEDVEIVNLEGSSIGNIRQGALDRRVLRSRYLAVKNVISNERDDITRQDSKRFKSIITEVEALHENVKKPREQVADAETLLDIASSLAISVRSQNNEGVTPSDLVTAILKNSEADMVLWENIGLSVSHIFKSVHGCCTMIGPMSSEIKQRKAVIYRKRTKPTERTRPEEIDCKEQETKTDTDSNMSTMFDILKKKRLVRLENLLLNRLSFAQTVENIFALSFLVKDGRAEITLDNNGCHLVSPKNAPTATAVASGAVSYHHFVFRFDYKDWKSMIDTVRECEELMPYRSSNEDNTEQNAAAASSSSTQAINNNAHSTPIKKLTRNRGLIVVEEDSIVEDSMEKKPPSKKKTSPSLKGKHIISF